ncbi:MAG: hypothetical protein AAF519_19195 [Bacteroidota bacterium]
MLYYVLNIAILGLWIYLSFNRKSDDLHPWFFFGFLILKLFAGFSFGLVYSYYYSSGDTFTFFHQGERLANLARSNFSGYADFLISSDPNLIELRSQWTPNLVFSKLVSVFCLLTNDSYWLISTYLSLFCFFSLWYLFQMLTQIFTHNKLSIVLALFVVPSFVFWSSGLSKEAVAIGCISLVVRPYLQLFFTNSKVSWIQWGVSLLALLLLWKLKYFYAAPLLVALLTAALVYSLHKLGWVDTLAKTVGFSVVIFCGILFFATLSHPNFYLSRIFEVIVENHDTLLAKSGDEVIRYSHLKPSLFSILVNSPYALVSGLFRPLPGEVKVWIGIGTGLENLLLLGFFIWTSVKLQVNYELKRAIFITSALLYILTLAVLLALSTPNFGTLMRFKVAFLPFLWMLILYNNLWVKQLSKRLFR